VENITEILAISSSVGLEVFTLRGWRWERWMKCPPWMKEHHQNKYMEGGESVMHPHTKIKLPCYG
jgi:hypothetical protein